MGASIPTALTLSLAIRDAVPGGSPLAASVVDASVDDASDLDEETRDDETGRARGSAAGIFKMEVRTGTSVVGDEITPEDDVSLASSWSIFSSRQACARAHRSRRTNRTKTWCIKLDRNRPSRSR